MRALAGFVVLAVLAGCTSLQTARVPSDELQQEIRAGGLVVPGEKIRVTTMEGTKQDMTVYRVDEDALHGHTVDGELVKVPIDDVAVLATEKLSIVRSAAFAYVGAPIIYGGILFTVLLISAVF